MKQKLLGVTKIVGVYQREEQSSIVVNMQPMQGVQYKISYAAVPANAPKKKKFPTKVVTSTKPETILGKFKVGTTLAISYKMISGSQESLPSQTVRFKVKVICPLN